MVSGKVDTSRFTGVKNQRIHSGPNGISRIDIRTDVDCEHDRPFILAFNYQTRELWRNRAYTAAGCCDVDAEFVREANRR